MGTLSWLTTTKGRICFVRLKSGYTVEQLFPLKSATVADFHYSTQELMNFTDASLDFLRALCTNSTLYNINNIGAVSNLTSTGRFDGNAAAYSLDSAGNITAAMHCYGELIKYDVTGVWYNKNGCSFFVNNKGTADLVVSLPYTVTTGSYFPSATIAAPQWLTVGFVDEHNHTAFANLFLTPLGLWEPTCEMCKSMSVSSRFANHYYTLFEKCTFQDEVEPEPPAKGDEFSLENRFSPRLGSNGLGIYPITQEQSFRFFSDLWNETFIEKLTKSVVGEATDAILTFRFYFGIKSKLKQSTTECYLTLGNNVFDGSVTTESVITTKPLLSEFVEFTAGEYDLQEHFHNYMDYDGYTNITLYVPFAGFVSLSPSDVMGGKIILKYNINVVTGQCLALISVENPRTNNGERTVIMTVSCDMTYEIPINVTKMASYGNLLATTLWAGATKSMSSGVGLYGVTSSAPRVEMNKEMFLASPEEEEKYRAEAQSLVDKYHERNVAASHVVPGAIAQLPQSGSYATGISSSGMNSELGSIGSFVPFLLITRPEEVTPEDIEQYYSKMSIASVELGTLSGYVQVRDVLPNSVGQGCRHLDQIVAQLKAGVYM